MEKVYLPDFLTVVYCYILWCNVAVEECVADDDMESANFYDCVDVDHVKDSYVKGEKENKRAIHEIIENEENLLNWHMIELEKLNEMGIIIHDQDFMERKKKMQYFCNWCISHTVTGRNYYMAIQITAYSRPLLVIWQQLTILWVTVKSSVVMGEGTSKMGDGWRHCKKWVSVWIWCHLGPFDMHDTSASATECQSSWLSIHCLDKHQQHGSFITFSPYSFTLARQIRWAKARVECENDNDNCLDNHYNIFIFQNMLTFIHSPWNNMGAMHDKNW